VLAANANSTTVNDDEWTSDGAVSITLAGSTASADGAGVAVDDDTVTITAAGTYVLTEQLDGQVDSLTVEGGTVTVNAGGDALKSDNEEDETRGYVHIAGGTISLAAGDDGINATSGTSTTTDIGGIVEADDGAMVTITGGESTINSEGDGIDSNGSILVTGGATTVFGSPEDREGALDTNGSLIVTSGTVIAEFTSVKSFQSVVLSAAALTEGSTYTVTVGGQTAGTVTAGIAAAGIAAAGGMEGGLGGPPARG